MGLTELWYAPILTVATLMTAAVAYTGWRRRPSPGALGLALMMGTTSWWAGMLVLQWVFTDHSPSLPWLVARMIGVIGTAIGAFVTAAEYTGRTNLLTRPWQLFLGGSWVFGTLMYVTDPLHHLTLGGQPPAMRVLDGGPAHTAIIAYLYLLIIAALVMLVIAAVRTRGVYRIQAAIIAACIGLSVGINLTERLGYTLLEIIPATPITFAVTGPLFAYALFRVGLLQIAPIARHRLVDELPDGVIILDHLGRVADFNPAARTMTGLVTSSESNLGRILEDVIPAWRETIETVRNLLGDGAGIVQVNSPTHPGRIIEVTVSQLAQPVVAEPASVVVLRDITQRTLVTAQLAEQTEALEATREYSDLVMGTIKEGVVLVDGEGEWLHANDAMRRIIGAEGEAEALSDPTGQLATMVQRVLESGAAEQTTIELPDGRTISVEALQLEGAPSMGPRAMLVVRDETERVRAERLQREFVANVSHEMKTPLTRLSLIADTLVRESGAGPERIELLAEMLESDVKRTVRMTEEFIALSRVEHIADIAGASFANVDLSSLVAEVLRRGTLVAEQSEIDLEYKIEPGVVVWGDERSLEMATSCLVDNALRYTDRGGRVTVSLNRVSDESASASEVVLAISDTGVGISEENQALIFERFFRVDKARSRRTGGTGLGLAIVKATAESHGGTVTVESAIGGGTVFSVRIPA